MRTVPALICLLTCGFGSWAVIAYYAGRRRSWPLASASAGYLLVTVVWMSTADTLDNGPQPLAALCFTGVMITFFGGAAHAAVLGGDHALIDLGTYAGPGNEHGDHGAGHRAE